MEKQVISKKRVSEFGEVYTRQREVNAMLDLVKQETERIDSRFLEPACGTGNFLMEVLKRKLNVVKSRYKSNTIKYERYAVLAVSSIYGIDLLKDNVVECRRRLFELFDKEYSHQFKSATKDRCRDVVRYILECNIIWGDALTFNTVSNDPRPIVFAEWSFVEGDKLKRRDFAFQNLLNHESKNRDQLNFFDLEKEAFTPPVVKEYPLMDFLEIANACQPDV